jgi:hypothetical protein
VADEQLVVKLLAEVSQLRAGMADAQRVVTGGVAGINDRLAALRTTQQQTITAWNQGWELAGRVFQTFGDVWSSTVGGVIARGEELQQLGRRMRAPTDEIGALSFAVRQAGGEVGDIAIAYRALSRALTEASDTGSAANRTLVGGLGYTRAELERLKSLAPHEAILAVGASLEQFADGAEKAAAGQQLFGRGYLSLLTLLQEGPEEIRRNIDIAREYGATMEQSVADAADRAGDSFERLTLAREGFFNRLFANEDLLNALAAAVESVADELAQMGRSMPQAEVDALRGAVTGLADGLRSLAPDAAAAAGAVGGLIEKVRWLIDNREIVAGAMAGAGIGGLAGPAGALVGGVIGAYGGGAVGAPRQADDAVLAQARADLEEARAAYRDKAGGLTGLGMTTDSGVSIPTLGDLGGPAGGGVRPPLRIPDDGKAEAAARRDAYEALLREQERALVAEQDSAQRRLEIVRAFSERIRATYGEESEEYDKQKLVVLRAEQAVGRERHEQLLRDQERDLLAVKDNAEARLGVIRATTQRIATEYGEGSREYQRQLQLQQQAEQAAADQRTQLAVRQIEQDRDAKLRALDLEKAQTEENRRLGRISQDQALDELQAYYAKRLAITLEAINRERALKGDNPEALAGLGGEEQAARGDAAAGEQGVLGEKQLALQQQFETVFSSIAQGWDRTILGMIQGTQTWQQAVSGMGLNLAGQLTSTFAQILARWAAMKLAELVIQRSTDAGKVASTATATASKAAIEAPEALASVTRNAAVAGSGAASAMASIPYVGPILAVVNMAAIFAAVMGMARNITAEGGADLGAEGAFAQLHPREMVLPANLADGVRRMAGIYQGADGAGAGTVGSSQAVAVTYNVQMMDTHGAEQFFERHGRTLRGVLEHQGRLRQAGR